MARGRVTRIRGRVQATKGRVTRITGRATPVAKGRVTRIRGRQSAYTVELRPGTDVVDSLATVELLAVTLEGPAPDSWVWAQTTGPTVVIGGPPGPARQIKTPAVAVPTVLTFSVTAPATGYPDAFDTASITVRPHAGLWKVVAGVATGRTLH